MAKSFVQLVAVCVLLWIIIGLTSMAAESQILALFVLTLPFLGVFILYLVLKSGRIFQNAEIALFGIASLVFGITYWLGDLVIQGMNIREIGLFITVVLALAFTFKLIASWEMK